MSQQNVEFVRRVYVLLDQGDEAVWDLASPELLADFSRRQINPVILRGRDQARAWYEWTYFGEDRAAALEAAGLSEQDLADTSS